MINSITHSWMALQHLPEDVPVGDISTAEAEEDEVSPPETGENVITNECEVSPPESGEEIVITSECEVSPPESEENVITQVCTGAGFVEGAVKRKSCETTADNLERKHREATIMVSGSARNGKSTALNNIFGLNLAVKASSKSVTQVLSVKEVTKKIPKPKEQQLKEDEAADEEVTLRIIDTPGLGAIDIKKEIIAKDMERAIKGENYTLLYCFSVSPTNNITDTDEIILKNLHKSLGKEVWNKCILLFTFSDHAVEEFEDSQEGYIQYIKGHAEAFQALLRKVTKDQSIVIKTIFEYPSIEKLKQDEKPSEIIAIPVNKKTQNSEAILPGMVRAGQDWTDIVFMELMKKSVHIPVVLYKRSSIIDLLSLGIGLSILTILKRSK